MALLHRQPLCLPSLKGPGVPDAHVIYGLTTGCRPQVMGCPEDEARWFFQQFIIGLDYCHKMGIANRDIKVRPAAYMHHCAMSSAWCHLPLSSSESAPAHTPADLQTSCPCSSTTCCCTAAASAPWSRSATLGTPRTRSRGPSARRPAARPSTWRLRCATCSISNPVTLDSVGPAGVSCIGCGIAELWRCVPTESSRLCLSFTSLSFHGVSIAWRRC